jgi:hypothetical protein
MPYRLNQMEPNELVLSSHLDVICLETVSCKVFTSLTHPSNLIMLSLGVMTIPLS